MTANLRASPTFTAIDLDHLDAVAGRSWGWWR